MLRSEVTVDTPDGACRATLHAPDGGAPAPAVIVLPDAVGVRETFRLMADRLAAEGFVALLPDVYHRSPGWAPFDAATVFGDPEERARLSALAGSVSAEDTDRDTGAFLDFLAGRPEVAGPLVGVTGYCMGGRAALQAAAFHPDRIGAAASFHGGRLAVADDPAGIHVLAPRLRAAVLVAAARDDASFPPEQAERLRAAFDAADVRYEMEEYPAAHGFAVPDNPTHDPAAEERHWTALLALLRAHLRS